MATRKKKTIDKQVPPSRLTVSDEELYQRIAGEAYELYQQRGEAPGSDIEDWLTAERLVHEELLHDPILEEPLSEEE